MKRILLATVIALSFSSPAFASSCDTPQTGFDNVYCFAKVYMDLDRQLNENYVSLMKMLAAGQKQVLREGQRGWIGVRNDECLRVEGGGNVLNINCALSTTRRRIQFLSDRLAECRATGCSQTKLGRISE